ncbi:hypothetical protein CIB95_05095 [Lottiidibacillus patelloidae]|uniref:Uncharacterized protein n=1 Tax=Lottiidibacillus patelloidae TaxID=2670334 RepID=A0A263BVG1_9BACI|nr:hypothetical protein [Lottiidibacillus patelloidae]OZM57743.1 hypothetical protein CIB95_05095 [Lottiidibacillus patelloidae]
MDALLEFIFSNIFFVVIIISAIYSFIQRSVAEEAKPRPTPKRKPMQFEPEIPQYERMTEMEKENERLKRESKAEEQEERLTRYNQSSNNHKMQGVIKLKDPVKEQKKKQMKQQKLHISKNEVVKGVIWSKILDEPRSKKPYKYRNIRG